MTVDETFIDTFGFNRQAWAFSGEVCRQTSSVVQPRLALILALDTNGSYYMSMHQANTDSEVFAVFCTKLLAKLITEDQNARSKVRLLIDNAAYHKNEAVVHRLM